METSIMGHDNVDLFIGVDVGEGEHHAVAINGTGTRLFDKALPNDESKLRALIDSLKHHGALLFVVDQRPRSGRSRSLSYRMRASSWARDAPHR